MTRYPEALARALEKIEADPEVLEAANRATAPLYIVNPIKSFEERAASLLRTHPPTESGSGSSGAWSFRGPGTSRLPES